MSNLDKWEKKHKIYSLNIEFLGEKFLTMSKKDFEKLVDDVREARENARNKKEAVEFGKQITKDVLIPLLIDAAKK